jgi:hypothetical protein
MSLTLPSTLLLAYRRCPTTEKQLGNVAASRGHLITCTSRHHRSGTLKVRSRLWAHGDRWGLTHKGTTIVRSFPANCAKCRSLIVSRSNSRKTGSWCSCQGERSAMMQLVSGMKRGIHSPTLFVLTYDGVLRVLNLLAGQRRDGTCRNSR